MCGGGREQFKNSFQRGRGYAAHLAPRSRGPVSARPGMGAVGRTSRIACPGAPGVPAAVAAPRGIPARPPNSPRSRPHLGAARPEQLPWGAAGPGARNATCPEPPPRRPAPFLHRPGAGRALPAGTEPGKAEPPMAVPGATAAGVESTSAGSSRLPVRNTALPRIRRVKSSVREVLPWVKTPCFAETTDTRCK